MLSLPSKHVLKALLSLSEEGRGEFLSVADLSEAAGVPSSYLSKLIRLLSEAGIVLTRKGPNGGVALPDRKVSFFEVCEALDDPIIFDYCLLSRESCSAESPCQFHSKWSVERERLQRVLQRYYV